MLCHGKMQIKVMGLEVLREHGIELGKVECVGGRWGWAGKEWWGRGGGACGGSGARRPERGWRQRALRSQEDEMKRSVGRFPSDVRQNVT